MTLPYNLYPRASEKKRDVDDPELRPRRMAFLKEALFNFVILQTLFLCLFAYIFGSLYQQTDHLHNLSIAFVDYDGGAIAAAFRAAYANLQGSSFPTLQERSSLDIPVTNLRDEVCSINYWAAVYVSSGASTRLSDALTGGEAAQSYDTSGALTLIWNQARYSTVVDSAIRASMEMLSSTARSIYLTTNGSAVLASTAADDDAAVAVFANPWVLTSNNIQPTTQGSRQIYNTLVFILVLIQEFFYLGTINGLYARFKLFGSLKARRIIAYRSGLSVAFCLMGSLCVTSMIWAFKAEWSINGNQFALNWAILWLFAHINFLVLDIFTVWLPPAYVPMALISWVVMNVTSLLLPFQLNPGFYRWAYALPAHEVFQVLIDIWSGGCNPRLHVALPVLFSWEIVGFIGSAIGVYRRCHYAVLAEEKQEDIFQERLKAAQEFERGRDGVREGASPIEESLSPDLKETSSTISEARLQRLAHLIRTEDHKLEQHDREVFERTRAFTFALPYCTEEGEGRGARLTRQTTAPAQM